MAININMHLREFDEYTPIPNINFWIDDIRTNCSDSLSVMQKYKHLLFRGLHINTPKVIWGDTPKDRRPRNTPWHVQTMLDNLLRKAGFKALRSNSIFCSGSEYMAQDYGDMFMVFPFNGFNFTWSPNVADLFEDFNDQDLRKIKTMIQKNGDAAQWFVKNFNFLNNENFPGALASNHEILIQGKYVAIEYNPDDSGPSGTIEFLKKLGIR